MPIIEKAIGAFNYFLELPFDRKKDTVLSILAFAWMIAMIFRTEKRYTKKQKVKRSSMKKIRAKLTKKKFRSDGSYFDEKRNTWVGEADFKEINAIPEEYYWDDIECRWLPPNHPDHPKFRMNDKNPFDDKQ